MRVYICQSKVLGFRVFQRTNEPISTFMIQIAVLANHQNGRDTHMRQIKVYTPVEESSIGKFPRCTTVDFMMYRTIRWSGLTREHLILWGSFAQNIQRRRHNKTDWSLELLLFFSLVRFGRFWCDSDWSILFWIQNRLVLYWLLLRFCQMWLLKNAEFIFSIKAANI